MVTIAEVSRLARGLPEVTEAERRGQLTWSVATKVFAWERQFSKADIKRFGDETPPEDPILAVRTADIGEKEAILAADPDHYFTIPHFDGFAAVLIQLKGIGRKQVREALTDGWLACAPERLAVAYVRRDSSGASFV